MTGHNGSIRNPLPVNSRFIPLFGIIIKKNDFGEGNAVLTAIDREKGKIEFSSFGSNKENSRKRSSLIISNLVSGILYRNNDLNYFSLKEVNIVKSYTSITSRLDKISYLYLIFEIIDKLLINESNFTLFGKLLSVMDKMEKCEDFKKYVFYLSLKIIKNEGILPYYQRLENNNPQNHYRTGYEKFRLKLGSGTMRFLYDIEEMSDPEQLESKKLSDSVLADLMKLIAIIITDHTGKELSSLSLINDIG